ncbi:MAG: hypothetical protein IJD76_04850 [Bacilli bacterium]|nr:hypothetical protein [Bacilli bacterium]
MTGSGKSGAYGELMFVAVPDEGDTSNTYIAGAGRETNYVSVVFVEFEKI